MFSSPHRIGPALRLAVARRPWIRWLVIGVAATSAGWLVSGQLQDVENARRTWTDQRTVFVAAHDLTPGEPLVVEERRLPPAAIPASALIESPTGEVARQRIAAGEVITTIDVADGIGPAAVAEQGEVVVAIGDPLLQGATLSIGLYVAIHSEGVVLAERARIVAIDGEIVFVAVESNDAPIVSAAAQMRLASLAFLR